MLRKTRSTEGGSHVCEICGRMSFKVFPISGDRCNQLQKKDADIIIKVCRSCFIKENGGHSTSSRIEEKNARPIFEHHPSALRDARASNSWHFIRRDLVRNKRQSLLNHECNENELCSSGLLSDRSFEDSSDEDTSYEDDDNDEEFHYNKKSKTAHVFLPFQKQQSEKLHTKGFSIVLKDISGKISHKTIDISSSDETMDESSNNELTRTESIINSPPESKAEGSDKGDTEGSQNEAKRGTRSLVSTHTVGNNITNEAQNISERNETQLIREVVQKLVDKVVANDDVIDIECLDEYPNIELMQQEELSQKLLNNTSNEISIILDSSCKKPQEEFFTKCFEDSSSDEADIFHCLFDSRCYVRMVKNYTGREKTRGKQTPQQTKDTPTEFQGVCKLVTIICHDNGRYAENPNTSVFDRYGYVWKQQDLPTRTIRKKKCRRKKQLKSDIDTVLSAKYKQPARKQYQREYTSSKAIAVEKVRRKTDFWPKEKAEVNIPETQAKKPVITESTTTVLSKDSPPKCAVCNKGLDKSYNVYDRENAPLLLLKHFLKSSNTIRVCQTCSPHRRHDEDDDDKQQSFKKQVTFDKRSSRKRGRGNVVEDEKESTSDTKPKARKFSNQLNRQLIKQKALNSYKTMAALQSANASLVKQKQMKRNSKVATQSSSTSKTSKVDISKKSSSKVFNTRSASNVTTKTNVTPQTLSSKDRKNDKTTDNKLKQSIKISPKQAKKKMPVEEQLMKRSSSSKPMPNSTETQPFLKVVKNPNATQLKKLSENSKTKYVIVQATSTSGGSTIQKLSTVTSGGNGQAGNITINGKRYQIDTEFKLNDLVKDNENAGLTSTAAASSHKELLAQLPGILKRTMGGTNTPSTRIRIVNVVQGNKTITSDTSSTITLSQTSNTSTTRNVTLSSKHATSTKISTFQMPSKGTTLTTTTNSGLVKTDKPSSAVKTVSINDPSLVKAASEIGYNSTQLKTRPSQQTVAKTMSQPIHHNFVITQGNITASNINRNLKSLTHQVSNATQSKNSPSIISSINSNLVSMRSKVLVNPTPLNSATVSPLNTPLNATLPTKTNGLAAQVQQQQQQQRQMNTSVQLLANFQVARNIAPNRPLNSSTPSGTKVQLLNNALIRFK